MNLRAIKYCRFKGEANEWSIGGRPNGEEHNEWLTFENINLIVGKNASGKSRTIDAIRQVSDLISGDIKISTLNAIGFGTASYELKFEDSSSAFEYELDYINGSVIQEVLRVDGKEKLNRKEGKLWYEGANEELEFQTDDDVLAISKRDKKQHSFFEKLFLWGKTLSHYQFGSQLGRNALLKDINSIQHDDDVNLKNSDAVTEIFVKGVAKFPIKFSKIILEDMEYISYDLKEIKASPVKNFSVSAYGLNVQESDIEDVTDQREMSQGMFRALSLLVQLNYSLLNNISSCILIDDIGEGLDFERSKKLIDLIIQKVEDSSVQVIMTTNDRFVMNKIPLKYWSVIQRVSKKSIFYNFRNSRDNFEKYKYTGLNNFDFLATEFYISGFDNLKSK